MLALNQHGLEVRTYGWVVRHQRASRIPRHSLSRSRTAEFGLGTASRRAPLGRSHDTRQLAPASGTRKIPDHRPVTATSPAAAPAYASANARRRMRLSARWRPFYFSADRNKNKTNGFSLTANAVLRNEAKIDCQRNRPNLAIEVRQNAAYIIGRLPHDIGAKFKCTRPNLS